MLIQNRTRAGWALIRSCKHRLTQRQALRPRRLALAGAIIGAIVLLVVFLPRYLSQETVPLTPNFRIQSTPQVGMVPDAPPLQAQSAMQIAPLPTMPPPPIAEIEAQPIIADHAQTAAITPPATLPGTESPATSLVSSEPTPDSLEIAKPPLVIGELPVKPGDTLIHLVRLVYGAVENSCMRSVLSANPQIQDPDTIDPKDVVAFPLVVFQWDDGDLKKHRIILKEVESLAAARDQLMDMSHLIQAPLRLFCYWSPGQGSRFQLALATQFDTQLSAQQSLAALPEGLATTASIRSGWPEGTLLLSNPVVGRPLDYRPNG